MGTAPHKEDSRHQFDAWCALFEGCTRIAELQVRVHATALGVVQRLRHVPGESMEAVVTDGTGRLRVVWTGRDTVEGLDLGCGLHLEGTVGMEDGIPLMRNPTWRLVRDPYACAEGAPGPQLRAGRHRPGMRDRPGVRGR